MHHLTQWQHARVAEFRKRLALFPTELIWKEKCFEATTTAKIQENKNQRSNILPTKPTTFTIWRKDYLSAQIPGTTDPDKTLTNRSVIKSYGQSYEIVAITDDPQDVTVDFRTVLKV